MSRRIVLGCMVISLIVLKPLLATAATVPVIADVSLNEANPDSNLNTITTRGGLLSGLDNTGSNYSFLLKFNLSGFAPTTIGSARLIGFHNDDFGPVDSFHQFYFVPDDTWSETIVTWNTRPATGAATAAGFEAAGSSPGNMLNLDLTADVVREANGDGVLSLAVNTVDGRFEDLEFFASREFDSGRAFRLEIQPAAIPLPPALLSGGFMLAAILASIIRRGMH